MRTIEALKSDESGWEHVTDFPNKRRGFSACAVDHKIYVFAGDARHTDDSDDYQTLGTWDAYDTTTRKWDSSSVPDSERTMPLIENWGQAVAVRMSGVGAKSLSVAPVRNEASVGISLAEVSGSTGVKRSPSELWVTSEDVPAKRHQTGTLKAFVMRGFVFYSFDPLKSLWTRLPDLKRDRGYFQSVALEGEIFAIGTYSLIASGTIEKYSFVDRQWSACASMPHRVRTVGAAVYQRRLCVMGGVDDFTNEGSLVAISSFHSYDASSDEWKEGPSVLSPRYRHAAVEYNGRLWVAGGKVLENAVPRTTNSVEVYSEEKGCWEPGPPMLRRRDFFNLLVVDGRLYAGRTTFIVVEYRSIAQCVLVGGDVNEAESQITRTIEALSTDGVEWEHVTDFPNSRRGFSTCALGSKIYVFAGDARHRDAADEYQTSSTWDAFDVSQKVWESSRVPDRDRIMPLIDNWGQAVALHV